MKEIYAKDIGNYLNKRIEFYGWIHTKRIHGKISFIILRDKTGTIQATFKEDKLKNKYQEIINIPDESVIKVIGDVKEKPKGGYEIEVEDFEIINKAYPLPIEIWNEDVKTQFIKRVQYRFLDLRRDEIRKIFEIRSIIINTLRSFLLNKGFIEFNTPKIVILGSESGSDVFEVNYYGKVAYLSQSPQLYKQMLMASGVDRYFEFSHYWRAEKSHTPRHLSEFYGLDVEIAWIKDLNDILDFFEEMIIFLFKNIKDLADVKVPKSIPRLDIKEVYKLLSDNNFKINFGDDLSTDAEQKLGEIIEKEYGEDIVIVYGYPTKHRPFYTMKYDNDLEFSKSFDCIYRGLEIASGAQREHRYEKLLQNIREKGIDENKLFYYLEAFKYGMPPHGGFGLGIDRLVKQILKLNNIRESVLWFRDVEHLIP